MQGMLGVSCESASQARQCRRQPARPRAPIMAAHELRPNAPATCPEMWTTPARGEGGGRRTVQLRGVELNLSGRSQTYVL